VLQAELSDNVRLKDQSELDVHNYYRNQAKASLVYDDRETVIDKKERNSDVINRNLLHIIPTNVNKRNSKQNLNDDEWFNMSRKETEVKNIMNHTLIKEKRILIVGDSHVKGVAREIQHKLNKNYIVQGAGIA
jgi:hypothetical protein